MVTKMDVIGDPRCEKCVHWHYDRGGECDVRDTWTNNDWYCEEYFKPRYQWIRKVPVAHKKTKTRKTKRRK